MLRRIMRMDYHAAHEALMLARALLGGYIDHDARGLPHRKYLAGLEETRARSALAGILRSENPLDPDLRDKLAALFDPAPDTHLASEREIIFRHRGKGQRRDIDRTSAIALHVWDAVRKGSRVNAAIRSAAVRFAIDERNAWKALKIHRPALEATWPLPRGADGTGE
jgi:hypothetical protein